MRIFFFTIIVAALAISAAVAQQRTRRIEVVAPPSPGAPPHPELRLPMAGGRGGNVVAGVARFPGRNQNGGELQGLQLLWEEAESDTERDQVRDLVDELLGKDFAAGLQAQEKEINEIEQRVEELKARLDKRRENKDEIVGLQARQIIMNWEGLGWRGAPPTKGLGPMKVNTFFGRAAAHSHPLKSLLMKSIESGEEKKINAIIAGYAKRLSKMEDTSSLNQEIWQIYKSAEGHVDSPKFWDTLAGILEDRENLNANTLDTLARLKYEAGALDAALKYQKLAVEKDDRKELIQFLKQLQDEKNED